MGRRGWLNEFSLLWVFPVVYKGWSVELEAHALPELPADLRADVLVPRAHAEWAREVERTAAVEAAAALKGRRRAPALPSLWRVICRLSWPYLLIGLLMSAVQGIVTTVARPLLIRQLVLMLQQGASIHDELLMVAYLSIALLVEGWSGAALKHALSDYLGTIWFVSASALVQAKALRVPGGTTTVQEAGLVGNDILRVYENQRFASILPEAVFALIGGIVVLVLTIGTASAVGLTFMLTILLVNGRIAKLAQHAEEEDLEACDARLSLMMQIISGIKAIKLSAWEDSFLELMHKCRMVEMQKLRRYRTLHQTSVQIGRACPALCAGISFIYLAATTASQLQAADVFAALNVFLSLRLPLIVIPECIT